MEDINFSKKKHLFEKFCSRVKIASENIEWEEFGVG